jgi:predicted RNA-binding protein with PIN domain
MSHRKVTKGRDALRDKLAGIRGSAVTLVFDGKAGETESDDGGTNPRMVVTNGGDAATGEGRETADEWISREMASFPDRRALDIEVVTADRYLRRLAHECKAKTINPSKFWRRYLPRLKGMKSDYSNVPGAGERSSSFVEDEEA